MNDLVTNKQVDISEYVIPSRLFSTTRAIGTYEKVYYLTDLHLEHYINLSLNVAEQIGNIVSNLTDDTIASYNSLIFIGGDVADSYHLSEVFYRLLRSYYPDISIIAVLGNHEISEFDTLEEAVVKYRSLFEELNIYFPNNSGTLAKLWNQRFVCVGGIGFAPFNDIHNADTLIVSKDIQHNREREAAESRRFFEAYEKYLAQAVDLDLPLLVFTHYPINDWLPQCKVDPHCYYFNGHNHSNDYYFKDGAEIIADNQIGNNSRTIKFKDIDIGININPFHFYNDGYYEITYKDYYAFHRYNGLFISIEGKAISNHISKGARFYMIKKNGFYMFVLVGAKESWLCVGAGIRTIQGVNRIEYFYNAFDTIVQRYISLYATTYKGLQVISEKLKKYGFDGRVHGFIIDIDYFNHIMINPFDGKITFYYSPVYGFVREYPSFVSLLNSIKENTLNSGLGLPEATKQEIARLDKAIAELVIGNKALQGNAPNQGNKSPSPRTKRVDVGRNSMYGHSRHMLQIQRLFDCNILREWDAALIDDLNIADELKPVKKTTTPFMMVKNDWRNYLQIDSQSRTKKTTMVCFPDIRDYEKREAVRIWFPYKENGKTESINVIRNYVKAIPQSIISDPDVIRELVVNLNEKFFKCYPKELFSIEVIDIFIDFTKKGRLFDFPPEIMRYDLWKHIYDRFDYSEYKTRPKNFPKEVWKRIRSEQ